MRRLQDYQHVTLQVGRGRADGHVVATHGDEAVVRLDRPLGPWATPRPCPARLSFMARDHPVVLDGIVVDDGAQQVRLLGGEGICTPDRRDRPRLAIALAVSLTPPDGGTLETTTVDVSAGGLLVAAPQITGPVAFALTLPGGHVVTADAEALARPNGSAIVFTRIGDDAVRRLSDLVLSVRAALAQRFAERRAS